MHVHAESRRPEDRLEPADKPIEHTQAKRIAAVFDKAVVVGGEDVEPLPGGSATGEGKQERAKVAAELLAFFIRQSERPLKLLLCLQNRLQQAIEFSIQFALPSVDDRRLPLICTSENAKTVNKLQSGSDLVLKIGFATPRRSSAFFSSLVNGLSVRAGEGHC